VWFSVRRRLIQIIFDLGVCAGVYSKFTNCASYQKGWHDQANKVRIGWLLFPTLMVIVSEKLPTQFSHFGKFRIGYKSFFLAQVQQTARAMPRTIYKTGCANGSHMHDLAGADVPFTQKFIAQMMGMATSSAPDRFHTCVVDYISST
jgi:hypothetical protein